MASASRNRELEARIAADPDNLEPRLIYGDWLEERGDPLGRLISLSPQGHEKKFQAHLKKSGLLGEHAKLVPRALKLRWLGGFVDHLEAGAPSSRTDHQAADILSSFLALPICRFLRRLSVRPMGRRTDSANHQQVQALCKRLDRSKEHAPHLEHISFSGFPHLSDLAYLSKLPSLRRIEVHGLSWLYGRTPEIEQLHIIAPGNPCCVPKTLKVRDFSLRGSHTLEHFLRGMRLPIIERLEIATHHYVNMSSFKVLEMLLKAVEEAPALEHLGIECAEQIPRFLTDLSRSPQRATLRSLSLRSVEAHDRQAHEWIEPLKALEALESLQVRAFRFAADDVEPLKRFAQSRDIKLQLSQM